MCHTHSVENGIDLMRAELPQGELTVSLGDDGCHYILAAKDLIKVILENPWAEDYKAGTRHPALACDDSAYRGCHGFEGKKGYHEHRFNDLWRFERVEGNSATPLIEVTVTACNCHVEVPTELVFRLFAGAEEQELFGPPSAGVSGPILPAELHRAELEEWARARESANFGEEVLMRFWMD